MWQIVKNSFFTRKLQKLNIKLFTDFLFNPQRNVKIGAKIKREKFDNLKFGKYSDLQFLLLDLLQVYNP